MPAFTSTEWIVAACIIGVPLIFTLGRYSTRITWFHARTEEKYSLPEFMRNRE